jgi:uncharacterized iron-regulated membrane protein
MKRAMMIIILLLTPVHVAVAGGFFGWHAAPHFLQVKNTGKGRHISEQQAVSMAERRMGGRALSVKRVYSHGRKGYRIKILGRHGTIRFVYVDAVTGTVTPTY